MKNLSKTKLAIIRAISDCENEDLLATILQMINRFDQQATTDFSPQKKPWEQSDLDDLQQSIDEIFES